MRNRLVESNYIWICLLMLAMLVMHFIIIDQPGELMIDEQYYVNDARAILSSEGELRTEHPPLGELILTLGMLLFGDTPLGWRFFSVLLGTAGIGLFYLICRKLEIPPMAAFLATFLLALENLSFVQSSIAMLDVYSVSFMLLAFWLYLRRNYALTGMAICLAILTKLSGALALPVIALHWLLVRRDRPLKFSASMLLVPLLFVGLIPLLDFAISRQLLNPIDRVTEMFSQTIGMTFANTTYLYASRPWEWLLWPQSMPYWYTPHYTATISLTVWALIIPSVAYMALMAKKGGTAGLFAICWLAGTYLLWIPANLITDRLTYIYYFYPTLGAICIGLGLGLFWLINFWKKATGKLRWAAMAIVLSYLLLHTVIFVLLSPLSALGPR